MASKAVRASTQTSGTGIWTEPGSWPRLPRLGSRRRRGRHSGFSLLELLVVVVIIGILASMFTLSVGLTGADRELESSLERLAALLAMASEDALLQGRELGLRFDAEGYEFLVLADDGRSWTPLSGDRLFRRRNWPTGTLVELELEGRLIVLEDPEERAARERAMSPETGDAASGPRPQLFIFSSGELLPEFSLRLRRRIGDRSLALVGQADGSVEIVHEA